MKNTAKKVLSGLGILITLAGIAFLLVYAVKPGAGQQAGGPAMRVPVDIWPGNFWIIIADKKGFFEEEGLAVELIDVSSDYFSWVDRLDTNEIDTMAVSIFDLVSKNVAGADLACVLYSDASEGAEGILAKEPYNNLDSLKGKKIGVSLNTYLEFFLDIAMMNENISGNDFQKADYQSESLKDAYGKGEVDAIIIWEPDLSLAQQEYGGNIVFTTSSIQGLSPTVFVFRRDFIKSRAEDVSRFVRVWKKTSDYMTINKKETLDILFEFPFAGNDNTPYSEEDIVNLMEKDRLTNLNDNLKAFSFYTGFESLYGNAQYVIRFFEKKGEIMTPVDSNLLFDGSFVRGLQR